MAFPTRVKAYLLLLSILALGTSVSARKNTTNGLQSTLSFNTVVGFQVTLPDGTTNRLAATEGQMARIGNNAEGWQFGVIPFVTDTARSVVQFDVFRITNDKAGNPSVHFLGDLQVSKNSPVETQTDPKLQIQVLQLAAVAPVTSDAEAAPALADNAMGPAGSPTSGRMIKVEFTLPGGGTAQVGMAEGQMAKIGVAGKWEMGFVPFIEDESQGLVHLDTFTIVKDKDGAETPHFLRSAETHGFSAVSMGTIPDVQVRILNFGDLPKESAEAIKADCCTSCDNGLFACGICAYIAQCDACCGDSLCCP